MRSPASIGIENAGGRDSSRHQVKRCRRNARAGNCTVTLIKEAILSFGMAPIKRERRKRARRNDPLRRRRRADPRADIVLPASIDALTGHRRTSLLDISLFAACLQGANLPSVGREAILKCEAIDTFGTVAWSVGQRCGVRFDEPISAATLVAPRRIACTTREPVKRWGSLMPLPTG